MRIYITNIQNEQEIINLDTHYEDDLSKDIINPPDLNGSTIVNCIKDEAGDIIFTVDHNK